MTEALQEWDRAFEWIEPFEWGGGGGGGGATFWEKCCLQGLRALHINGSHSPNSSLSRNPKGKREVVFNTTKHSHKYFTVC